MSAFVGLHNKVYVAHLNLTGLTHKVDFGPIVAQMQTCTTFADGGYDCFKPGMKSGSAQVDAYQDFDVDVLDDEISVGQLGNQYAFTVAPDPSNSLAVGDPAVIVRGVFNEHNPFGGVKGEMANVMLKLAYDTAAARAKVGHLATAVTQSGSDSAVTLAGPTATQKLYAAVHVFSITGFSQAVVKVQSDDNSGFTSATDRITFATITGPTSEYASVPGPFSTETHHRVITDVTGSGSIVFAVAFGVA